MIFSNNTSVFISEYCVSDNPIRYERPRTPTNDHEYYQDTTRNDPDPATVELRLRPRPQSSTIHPDEFKDICGYFQCAPFPRLQTGKVVWVLSFDP